MGLEASEEGYIAKILVEEKTRDIPLKTVISTILLNFFFYRLNQTKKCLAIVCNGKRSKCC
jgi:hypothetical protein